MAAKEQARQDRVRIQVALRQRDEALLQVAELEAALRELKAAMVWVPLIVAKVLRDAAEEEDH